jgi:hypothetical protein
MHQCAATKQRTYERRRNKAAPKKQDENECDVFRLNQLKHATTNGAASGKDSKAHTSPTACSASASSLKCQQNTRGHRNFRYSKVDALEQELAEQVHKFVHTTQKLFADVDSFTLDETSSLAHSRASQMRRSRIDKLHSGR